MEVLVWAAMFLALTVVGSLAVLIGMIGLPIGLDLQAGLGAMAALVAGTGVVVLVAAPVGL